MYWRDEIWRQQDYKILKFLYWLTCFRYLTLILEDKCPIDPRDYEDFFDALSSTPNGITALNHFLHKHVSEVITHVKDGGNLATKIFSILVSKSSTKSEIEKVKWYYILVKLYIYKTDPFLIIKVQVTSVHVVHLIVIS